MSSGPTVGSTVPIFIQLAKDGSSFECSQEKNFFDISL